MSNEKFTPGPWMFIIDELENEHPIMSLNENKNIACVNSSSHLGNCLPEESQSNAKLIAAVPELLEACQRALEFLESENIFCQARLLLAVAIKKATS